MKTLTSWSNEAGSILSAAGFAIGLGAIWKFLHTVGTSDGVVFLLLSLLSTVLIALPVQLARFYTGRKNGKNAVDVFRVLAPDTL